jgi:putative SOS response-associated peptidase YedK
LSFASRRGEPRFKAKNSSVQSVFDDNEPKAIRDLFNIGRGTTGNLPPLPAIFPDQVAPVVRIAGIWTEWTGVRGTKANPVEGKHLLYGFLTTEANGIVGPIHPKAMPVILTTREEWAVWMRAWVSKPLRIRNRDVMDNHRAAAIQDSA